jgi:putative peptide zinc metalloprotease protein
MTTDAPRSERLIQLRPDLQQSRQQHQGKSYLVVKDPLARRYFRFTESQAAILDLMASPTTPERVAVQIADRLGATVPAATIAAFCDSLEAKDLLETPAVRERLGSADNASKRARSSILYKQVASFDPERIFNWLLPRTRWAFTRSFQVFGCLLIATGLSIFFSNWQQLKAQTPNLFDFWTLLMVWPIVFGVSAYHEFSHGLTCSHFGGRVKEMGFMLIYFSPAFYCDVSDAWMFPNSKHRMAVTLAGGYSQLMLWGVCAIVWRVTDTNTMINHVMLVVVLFSGLQTLFNFNPLIKLDGYYMLSDYLEVPNLRSRGFSTLWKWISREPRRGRFRDVRAVLLYAVCAVVFSSTLLVTAYAAIYTWATGNWATAGLVGFVVFSTLTLRRTAVESMSGLKVLMSHVAAKKFRNAFIVLAVLLVAFIGRWELKIPADFRILPQDEFTVKAETSGVLVEVLARENMHVRKGDVLARTRDAEKQAVADTTSGELKQKTVELERLIAGPLPLEISEQESKIAAKNVEIANASRNLEQRNQLREVLARKNVELETARKRAATTKELVEKELWPPIRLIEDQSAVDTKGKEITETEAAIRSIEEKTASDIAFHTKGLAILENQLTLLKQGNRKELVREKQAEVDKLRTLLAAVTKEIAKSEIRAKIDGTVVTPFPERKAGTKLAAGDEFIRLVNTSGVIAEMLVPEKDLSEVQPGNVVWLKVRSLPRADFEGRVATIAPIVTTVDGQQMVVVRTEPLPNENELLKPDNTGVARIYAGERRIIDIATRKIRNWVRTEFLHLLP